MEKRKPKCHGCLLNRRSYILLSYHFHWKEPSKNSFSMFGALSDVSLSFFWFSCSCILSGSGDLQAYLHRHSTLHAKKGSLLCLACITPIQSGMPIRKAHLQYTQTHIHSHRHSKSWGCGFYSYHMYAHTPKWHSLYLFPLKFSCLFFHNVESAIRFCHMKYITWCHCGSENFLVPHFHGHCSTECVLVWVCVCALNKYGVWCAWICLS